MVSLVPNMGHGHGPGWNRPESYAFVDSMMDSGHQGGQTSIDQTDGVANVLLRSDYPLQRATLVYTTGSTHGRLRLD